MLFSVSDADRITFIIYYKQVPIVYNLQQYENELYAFRVW